MILFNRKPYFSIQDVASVQGESRQAVFYRVKAGIMQAPMTLIGKRKYYSVAQLEEMGYSVEEFMTVAA